MVFNTFQFVWTLPIVFILYYCLMYFFKKSSSQLQIGNAFLLITSYILYIQWRPVSVLFLLYVTAITYIIAIILNRRREKWILWTGIILTIIPLLFIKYSGFINEAIRDTLSLIGVTLNTSTTSFILPLGLSFFTFQALGYLADSYNQKVEVEKNWWHYMLFVGFFPQIASGPINRANQLLPQIKNKRIFNSEQAIQGLKWILWGMFMKVVMADRIGLYVDTIFNNYQHQSGLSCILGTLLFSFQIYGDFAGYSFMALGVGELFGFEMINNFRRPYLAASVTEFWHRWHISLSFWLRDYIYIPLGGSRCSKIKNYRNIFITFLVSGIWHGANWTFIFWGALHGILQVIEKALKLQKVDSNGGYRIFRILFTFFLINVTWIFFKLPTISDSFKFISRIITNHDHALATITPAMTVFIALSILVVIVKDLMDEYLDISSSFLHNRYTMVRWGTYITLLVMILLCGVFDASQFIYVSF